MNKVSCDSMVVMHILLAEDTKLNQLLIQALLHKLNIDVTFANNGLEAITLLESNQAFDLVLMDVEMPEMDGRAATRQIRKDPRFVDLPIIALTAHCTDEEKQKCLDAGMNDVMTKPINNAALFKVLSTYSAK
jgi:two-component system, sensor histidine kinase and response regulator